MLSYPKFEKAVWLGKTIGFVVWAYIPFTIYTLLEYFILIHSSYSYNFSFSAYIISYITALLPFFFYKEALSVVPRPHLILTFPEWTKRFFFIASEFAWIFLHLSSILPTFSVVIITFFEVGIILSHVLYIPVIQSYDFNQTRYQYLLQCYPKSILKITGISFLLYVITFFNKYSLHILLSFTMFSVFEYFLIIFSIIVGEKTSFSLNNDASRLSEGLKSRSPIFQYLASQDFADVSKDPKAHRRGFIYRDDGIMFSQIVKTFTQTIDDICRINTIEPSKANSIAQTDRLIPSLIKFYNDVIKDQKSFGKSSFQLFIEFPFITLPKIYRRYTSSRNSLMMKKKSEYSVVSKSYVVMNEIEALTTLMFKAADEDKVGIIQVHAETILKSLLKLHCALGKNANRQWVTPPFAPISKTVYNMNAFDYKELLNYVLEITDWALRELLLTDQMNFDFSLVGEEYKETIDGIKKIYADIN